MKRTAEVDAAAGEAFRSRASAMSAGETAWLGVDATT